MILNGDLQWEKVKQGDAMVALAEGWDFRRRWPGEKARNTEQQSKCNDPGAEADKQ